LGGKEQNRINMEIFFHMEFYCVYLKTRKKLDKYVKVNRIKNKYIVDIKKILEEEELNYDKDRTYLKILVNQKIQLAIEKDKDIYYVPDFEHEFSIEKLLNIKKLLGDGNNFNILIFFNDFRKDNVLLDDVLGNLTKFTNSQIIRDY
jgi:predicted transcriptional regulator